MLESFKEGKLKVTHIALQTLLVSHKTDELSILLSTKLTCDVISSGISITGTPVITWRPVQYHKPTNNRIYLAWFASIRYNIRNYISSNSIFKINFYSSFRILLIQKN